MLELAAKTEKKQHFEMEEASTCWWCQSSCFPAQIPLAELSVPVFFSTCHKRVGLTSSKASTSVVKFGLDLYFWMTEERKVFPAHSMNTWRKRGSCFPDAFSRFHSQTCNKLWRGDFVPPVADQQTAAEPSSAPSDPKTTPGGSTKRFYGNS